MSDAHHQRPIQLLMVEDSPEDAELMTDALRDGSLRVEIHHVEDGEEAIRFLRGEAPYERQPQPDLVLLDLHLPKISGHEVLSKIKDDARLKLIPVVVFTSSHDDLDYGKAYDLFANCCVTKPVDPDQFVETVEQIERFWLYVASRLRRPGSDQH